MRRLGVLVALLALAGCGGSSAGSGESGTRTPRTVPAPLQVANGPVQAADPGNRPLTLKLTATADPVSVRFKRPPRSGLLFDLDTGEVLWRRLPDRVLPIASLTKMMTALIVV
jgi:serine-type D-Ala-D-Ala carboxypeptidase (penicillin-binding protein 5/6)